MSNFNPEMMILARERKGLSQTSLAERLGITQASVSRYEAGLVIPPTEHVSAIAEALDRPIGYFFLRERMYSASCLFHRRRAMTLREERQIHAHVNELRIRASILLREAEIESKFQFHRLDATKRGPASAAQEMRRLWQLPTGPIRSVVRTLERAGGLVFRCGFGTRKVDGISQWPIDSDEMPPVFFVNEDVPGDRQRWTLAHECGHVVMHHMPSDDPEREANQFAAEFLMPAREIAGDLGAMTLPKAAALKSHWKVSMAAIIWRAHSLNKLNERQYRYLNVQLAARGYKTCEPVPIRPEEPELFSAILDVHRKSFGRKPKELSSMLEMYEHQFAAEFGNAMSGLKIAG